MPVYMGENGVVRRANNIYVGVDGVTRSILQGFNAVGSARRQFFGRLDDISYVEVQLTDISTRRAYGLDNYGDVIGTTLATANQYGDVYISGTTLRVSCSSVGYGIWLHGLVYAHFQDGRVYPIYVLRNQLDVKYDASISCSADWIIEFSGPSSSYGEGGWICWFCGAAPSGWVDEYASGTMYPTFDSNYSADVSAQYFSGSGITVRTTLTLPSYVTIDGHSIPLVINNQLT